MRLHHPHALNLQASEHLATLLDFDGNVLVYFILHLFKIERGLTSPHSLHIGYRRVFLTLKNGVDFFERLPLRLDPVYGLRRFSITSR